MRNTSYFSHDSNARNDEKILAVRMKFGMEGYGIYFAILERLRDSADYMSIRDYNVIAFDFRVSAEKVKSIVEDFGLFVFTEDGKYFYSESFLQRMKLKDLKSEKARESANLRWKKETEMRTQCERIEEECEGNASKVKESKEIKVNNIIKEEEIKEEERPKTKKPSKAQTVFRFVPPTLEELKKYIAEKNYKGVDPVTFISHYNSNGWKVGKNKMVDWHATVDKWERTSYEYSPPQKKRKPATDNYDVNEIWKEQIEQAALKRKYPEA